MFNSRHSTSRKIFIIATVCLVFIAVANNRDIMYSTAKSFFIKPVEQEDHNNDLPVDSDLYEKPEYYSNYLVLGLDNRGLSDFIIIVSYNKKTNQVILTSVSRNTFVSDQTWAEKDKAKSHICFAHYYGMGEENNYHQGALQTAQWVEHLLGIQIHDYASITYESFIYLIDLIGGVEIYVDPAFEGIEPYIDEVIMEPLPTGLQRLSGEQTFAYSRYRGRYFGNPRIPEPGSTSEDGDRIRRNQRLLLSIYKQVRSLKMIELLPILFLLPNHINTSLDVKDIKNLAPLVYKVEMEELIAINLPGKFSYDYEELTYYYHLDYERSFNMLRELGLIY